MKKNTLIKNYILQLSGKLEQMGVAFSDIHHPIDFQNNTGFLVIDLQTKRKTQAIILAQKVDEIIYAHFLKDNVEEVGNLHRDLRSENYLRVYLLAETYSGLLVGNRKIKAFLQ
ncbi:hypothetical protein GXP67_34145 [Rhodocytophaga rosea]|uniref:Uncharacterized protein n=1 Tax=Rhodocytophaga rosea TaxID=2704465 RepID=A0A6C0GVK3_9BACT|nr:hypothetical protein [Rhodocytophaga rosea]QHT71342.1 hypothetical protein GXP67_34145 [Rhodocytophaga rosea]